MRPTEPEGNEIKFQDFTPSERVAILRTLERKPHGDQVRSQNLATMDESAQHASLGNRETAQQAEQVVDHGTPELIEAKASYRAFLRALDNRPLEAHQTASAILITAPSHPQDPEEGRRVAL